MDIITTTKVILDEEELTTIKGAYKILQDIANESMDGELTDIVEATVNNIEDLFNYYIKEEN